MPNWRKLVVSGSDARLNSLFTDGPITGSAFSGDGSGLTNIQSASFATQALTASFALNAGGGTGVGFPFSGSAVITGSLEVVNSSLESIVDIRNNTLFLNGFEVPNHDILEKMVVEEPDATFTNFTTVTHNGEIVTNS